MMLSETSFARRWAFSSDGFYVFYSIALSAFLLFALGQTLAILQDFAVEVAVFMAIGTLSIIGQYGALKANRTVYYISFVFTYLFMAITPLLHLGAMDDFVFLLPNVVMKASIAALIFTTIGSIFVRRTRMGRRRSHNYRQVGTGIPNYSGLTLLNTVFVLTGLLLFGKNLFTTRLDFEAAQLNMFGDPQISILVSTLLISTPFFGAAIGLREAYTTRNMGWTVIFATQLMLAEILSNPFVTARFRVAGFAFFLIDYVTAGRGAKLLAAMILLGVVVAPTFQAFRSEIASDLAVSSKVDDPILDLFLSYDYDAFQTLCYSIVTVERDGNLLGTNFLGAALFFVPRAWWSSKPDPSPFIIYQTMRNYRDIGTDNLSTALMAEGYLAFSWIGVVFVSILYWWSISALSETADNKPFVFLIKSVFLGLTLIFLRGSLIVATSAVAGSIISATVPWIVLYGVFLRPSRSQTSRQLSRTHTFVKEEPVRENKKLEASKNLGI